MANPEQLKTGQIPLLIGGIAIGLLFVFLATSSWQQREQQWDRQQAMHAELTQRSIELSQIALGNQAMLAARSLAEEPGIRELLARIKALADNNQTDNQAEIQRLRGQLRTDLNRVWSVLQSGGAQMLEVHLANPVQTLLRMQHPDRPMDGPGEEARPLLNNALQSGQEQTGIESGPLGVLRAAVVPILSPHNGTNELVALIAVGFSVLPGHIAQGATSDTDLALLMPPSEGLKESKLDLTEDGRWLIGRDSNPAFAQWLAAARLTTGLDQVHHQQLPVDNQVFHITSLPLLATAAPGSQGDVAGLIIAWHDISAAAAAHRQDQTRLLINWLLAYLATSLFLAVLIWAFRNRSRHQIATHEKAILAQSQQRERNRQLLAIIAGAQSSYIQRDQIEQGYTKLLEQILFLTDSRFGAVGQVKLNAEEQPELAPFASCQLSKSPDSSELQSDPAKARQTLADNTVLITSVISSASAVIEQNPAAGQGLSSFLGLPIHYGDRLVGVLALGNRDSRYTADMVEFLTPLIATLGQLINAMLQARVRQQIQERLERQRQALRSLNEIAAAPNVSNQDRLTRLLDLGCNYLQLDLGLVSRIEGPDYYVIAANSSPNSPAPGNRFDLDNTYCSLAYQNDDVMAIDNMGSSKFSGHPCYRSFQLEAYIGVPLMLAGVRYGTLNFSSATSRQRTFDETDLEFMRLSARWTAALVESAAAEQQREALLERFSKITQHVPGMVYQYQLSANGHAWFPYTSEGIRQIYGITPEQGSQDASAAINRIHPDDIQAVTAQISESARNLSTWRAEYRVRHPKLGEIWVAGYSSPERLANGDTVWHGFIADITARKHIEQSLANEQHRLARVIAATGIGTWECDLHSNALEVNERWANMLGYQREELAPITVDTWNNKIHPADREQALARLHRHLTGNSEFFSCQYRVQHRSGAWIWIQDRGQVIERDAAGNPLWMSGTHADISAEMQREEEIRQARSFLDAVINAATEVAIIATDPHGSVTLFNSGAENLLGYSAQEVMGKVTPEQFHLPSEVQRRSEEISEARGAKVGGMEVFLHEARMGKAEIRPWTYVRKDGAHRLVNLTVTQIADSDGELTGFLGMATDITDLIQTTRALQKSESRFRGMVSNLPGAVYRCHIDQLWTMSYLSDEVERITGYPASDFVNNQQRSFASIIHPDDLSKARLSNHRARTNDASFELTYRILHAQGHVVQVREKGRAEYDGAGNLKWFDGFIWDVTEQVRVDQLKSQFVSTVSHELRTPLTAIFGSLKLVNAGVLGAVPEKMASLLATAEQNTWRLTLLINDLLDIDKLAAGKMHFELRSQPLIPILQKALELNKSYADQYQVSQSTGEMQEVWVEVDAMRLGQVLSNLLSNAAKFSRSGGDIRLSSQLSGNSVCISVTDQGQGIPEAFHDRIFQKFTQLDGSNTRQRGGSGLGLAISRELVLHMGGDIGFESNVGEGSRFWFCIPLSSPPHDNTRQESSP
ncbi:MAG: hypothetical protein CMK78_09005 [Pseudomonadales bacterium]|nr:hypothetical protein [Pseudomonadales bacterium]